MPVPRRQIHPPSQRSGTGAALFLSEGEDEEEENNLANLVVIQQLLEQEEDEDDEEDGDDDEEDGDDESDSNEEEEEEDNGDNVEYIEILDSPSRVCDGDDGKKGAIEKGKDCSPSPNDSQENGWDRNVTDDLFCPICMEAWASSGEHHVCCLPCGHIYGFSCIRKWLTQPRSSKKCPQCNKSCQSKDIRKLFAPRIAAVDGESHKRIKTLEAKCISLEKQASGWCKKEVEWKIREADLCKRESELLSDNHRLSKRNKHLENLLGDAQTRCLGKNFGSEFNRQGPFVLQEQLQVSGARLFDVPHDNQFLLVARRLPELKGTDMLSKMSLLLPRESEDIKLPSGTKAIRDLHISPYNGSHALCAALGRKLFILSTESNTITLSYDLPTAAWSCSWDRNSSHYIYAGLQDGSIQAFDIRQTARPVHFLSGLTKNPVHTIYSEGNSSVCSDIGSLISASSAGICRWNMSGDTAGPYKIVGAEDQGACTSLAYSSTSGNIVASYRTNCQNDMVSQTQHTSIVGQGVPGSHVLFEKESDACYQKLSSKMVNVNDVRLPRSAIINTEKTGSLFAAVDEIMGDLVLHELPSFAVTEHLKSPKEPIYDVKYTNSSDRCLLGALSGDVLQLYTF